jgi:hypothetical protein
MNEQLIVENSRITDCRFRRFHQDESCRAAIYFDHNEVDSNIFRLNWISDDYLLAGSSIYITENIFRDNEPMDGFISPFLLSFTNPVEIPREITGNLFLRNHMQEASCLVADVQHFFICARNFFVNNSNESILTPLGGAVRLYSNPANIFYQNIFYGNQGQAVEHVSNPFPPAYAQNCYWGDTSGPYNALTNPGGQGDTVDTLIIFEPWEPDTLFLNINEPHSPNMPTDFILGYPYPNPFNSSVTIEYALTREQDIRLAVYDVLGRETETLLETWQGIGVHRVNWNAGNVASGVYVARLSSRDTGKSQAVKLILMK